LPEQIEAIIQNSVECDLLLTDVVMPKTSGPELATRVAQRWPNIKALFMSGYNDEAVLQHGILESGVAYLQKPLTPESLTRKVRAVLDAKNADS